MPQREQADGSFSYRSPVTAAAPMPQYSQNEADYSTLKIVRDALAQAVEGLYKDFNAFTTLKEANTPMALANLLRQIEAKQMAFDILAPLLDSVVSAMQTADEKFKQRNNP